MRRQQQPISPIEPFGIGRLPPRLDVTCSQMLRIRDTCHPALRLGEQHTRAEDTLAAASSHELLFESRPEVAHDFRIVNLFNFRTAWEGRQLRKRVEVRL